MHSALVLSVAVVMAVAPTDAASAAQRYAAPSGSGTECSEAAPCALQEALDLGTSGEEVIVGPGTYVEAQTLEVVGDHVHGAVGMPVPLITSTANTAISVSSSGPLTARLSDVRIEHTGANHGVFMHDGIIERITSRSSGARSACAPRSGTLLDSVCFSTGSGAAAVYLNAPVSSTAALRNVTAIATGPGSRGIFVDAYGSGLGALGATNVITSGVQLDILAGDNADVNSEAAVTMFRSNFATTDTYGTQTSVTPPGGVTNQTAEPVFANLGVGDFRQVPGSPTIDAGDSSVASALDFERSPRPAGAAADIGADEAIDPATVMELGETTLAPKRKLRIPIACPIVACDVAAQGALKIPGRKQRKQLGGALSVAAGGSGELELTVSKRIKAKLKQKPKKANLDLTATATDPLGFADSETRRYKFKR